MTNSQSPISLEDLTSLHELQKQICDLTPVKCDGHLRVHVECQQGHYRNAVVISNRENDRSMYLFLTAQGWLMSAYQGTTLAWELPLIGYIGDAIGIIEDRIEVFLLPETAYQDLFFHINHGVQQGNQLLAAR
jgi:hypothetical protein